MAIVDLHQHFWPEPFVEALAVRSAPPCIENGELVLGEGRFAVHPVTNDLGARVATLDEDGVDVAVVSLQPTLGLAALPAEERDELELAWIRGMRDACAATDGRLLAFAPDRLVEGFVGVSVEARALADPDGIAPLLEELSARGLPLFVHPGPPGRDGTEPAWWAGVVDYTGQMQAAYFHWLAHGRERWPSLRVLFAILAGGAPFQLERLGQRGRDVRSTLDTNVFLDVATYGRRAIELCVETFGVHHLVYGSDRPVVDPTPTLHAVRGFGESVATLLCTHNPSELLP